MNKAEEAAQDLGYGKDPLNRVEYTANDVWDACIDGYHQAEKDLELTWEDISIIREILCGMVGYPLMTDKEECKEVLKRFKETKKVN